MGRLLYGEFELEIVGIRVPNSSSSENPNEHTARYNARVIRADDETINPDDIVSVRMLHHGRTDDFYNGMTGVFDGDANDIQDDPDSNIDTTRRDPILQTYINPFI